MEDNKKELDMENLDGVAGGAPYYATDKDFKAYENIANVRRLFPGGRQAELEMMKLRSFAFRGMSDEEIEAAYQAWKKKNS